MAINGAAERDAKRLLTADDAFFQQIPQLNFFDIIDPGNDAGAKVIGWRSKEEQQSEVLAFGIVTVAKATIKLGAVLTVLNELINLRGC